LLNDTTITFIGAGVMGEAMIRGLVEPGLMSPDRIVAADPWPARLQELTDRYGIQVTGDNREAAEAGQIVVLSIKPQSVPSVLPDLRDRLGRDDLLLSIVAGTPIHALSGGTGHAAVVRAMPNTPAQIGQGISVWTATAEVTSDHEDQARTILGALGSEVFLDDERYMDMATALSGSGPGYVFLVMEALIDAGGHDGRGPLPHGEGRAQNRDQQGDLGRLSAIHRARTWRGGGPRIPLTEPGRVADRRRAP
jgi:pyrroline-5-carboxylate reductase